MDRRGYLEPGAVVWAAADLDAVVPVALGPGLDVGGLLLTSPAYSLPEQFSPLAALSLTPDSSCSRKSLPLLPELPPPS